MQTFLRGRDMITTQEWTKEEIDTIIDVAFDLKRKRALGISHAYLRDKVLAMLFFFSSTRTRASFEAGMAQLGGHAQFIDSKTTQVAHGDTAKEIGEILGRYNDGISIRHCDWEIGNQYIRWVAEASRTPVLNMQCDLYHPHQILADLQTIIEKKGDPYNNAVATMQEYIASNPPFLNSRVKSNFLILFAFEDAWSTIAPSFISKSEFVLLSKLKYPSFAKYLSVSSVLISTPISKLRIKSPSGVLIGFPPISQLCK